MNFPGTGGGRLPSLGGGGGGNVPPGYDPNDPNVKWLTSAMESCYAKTVMSGAAGFALGGLFGMFMASVRLPPLFLSLPSPFSLLSPLSSLPRQFYLKV
jgi:import inner membrane translocase subunit TIM22